MGQTSPFAHWISPCLYPVCESRCYVIHCLQTHCRRISIATIACPLQMRTVDHISAKCQTLHSILNHIMNGVQVSIRTFESRSLPIIAINLERFYPFSFRSCRKVGDTDITISMMIEFIPKIFSPLSTCNIDITFTLFVKFSFFSQVIAIFHRDLMSRR